MNQTKSTSKKLLALLLALIMTVSLLPMSVFAAEPGTDETVPGTEAVIDEPDGEETESAAPQEEPADQQEEPPAPQEEPAEDAELEEGSTLPGNEETPDAALLAAENGIAVQAIPEKPADGTTDKQPFKEGTGGSDSFRIPAMVTLDDGTIVAAADARWDQDQAQDGGGNDTIVAYSNNDGDDWNYTFANYLGDNGNVHNDKSTCFIDPALATDGKNVYMLVDLFPHGRATVWQKGRAEASLVAGSGFTSDGCLKLSNDTTTYLTETNNYNYYLKDHRIYSGNNPVADYWVDDYFNIYEGDDENGDPLSNLFFADSPYRVYPTGYLYLTKSTDGGKTWSAPTLVNPTGDKAFGANESACIVGPGRGTVISDGTIIFPVYGFSYNSYYGSVQMQTGFIYSKDGVNWTRSNSGINNSSESDIVELSNGTLRVFYRTTSDNKSGLHYVDVTGNGTTGYSWNNTPAVVSGASSYSDCQLSAIKYSKTVGGYKTIIVSCPTQFDNITRNRMYGCLYLLNAETMAVLGQYDINTEDKDNTANSNCYQYSCLTELKDGSIGLLYERHANTASTQGIIQYAAYNPSEIFGVEFDESTVTPGETETGETIVITVGVGQTTKETYTFDSGVNVENGELQDETFFTASWEAGTTEPEWDMTKVTSPSTNTPYLISDGINYLTVSAEGSLGNTTNAKEAAQWTYSSSNWSGYLSTTVGGTTYYLQHGNGLTVDTSNNNNATWSVSSSGIYYTSGRGWSTTYYLHCDGSWAVSSSVQAANKGFPYSYTATESVPKATLTVTGREAGGPSEEFTIGNKRFRVVVVDKFVAEVAVGGTKEIFLPDGAVTEGQTVVWTVGDNGQYAGIYNSADGKSATLSGREEGTTTATATVKNANGTVAGTYNWNVTVTPGTQPNAGDYDVTYTITNTVYNGKLYYSVSGSPLKEAPLTETRTENGNTIRTYTISEMETGVAYSQLELFVAPDEGYAVSKIEPGTNGVGTNFYGIDKTNYDVLFKKNHTGGTLLSNLTEGQAKALVKEAVDAGCDAVLWFSKGDNGTNRKNPEGPLTKERDKTVNTSVIYYCDKLPTVEKKLAYLLDKNLEEITYSAGMVVDPGTKVVFEITVTGYPETAAIEYKMGSLKDTMAGVTLYSDKKCTTALTTPNPDGSVIYNATAFNDQLDHDRTGDKTDTYTYYAAYELTPKDLTSGEELVNKVELSYQYQSTYSTGAYGGSSEADAAFQLTDFPAIDTIVVDFGLPVKVYDNVKWAKNYNGENGKDKIFVEKVEGAKYGEVTKEGDNIKGLTVTYTPNTMNFEKDVVTLISSRGNQSTFTVIPASTVYYEDSFVKFYDKDDNEAKKVFTATDASDKMGTWYVDSDSAAQNNNVTQALEFLGDKENVYGYDTAYDNCTTFSMGSAKKVTVNAGMEANPTAKFTFKGTGFDVISLTDNNSGAIIVNVTAKDEANEGYNKNFLVNNYYGYAYKDGGWQKTESTDKNALYQIPVMKVTDLPYGEYAVTITVTYGEFFDKTGDSQYSFWLDAIRVYDPMGKDYADYAKDQEGWPQYIEIRNQLIENNKFNDGKDVVFIDGSTDATVEQYKNGGPNNEVYLLNGQSIAFQLKIPADAKVASVQIGAKAPVGSATLLVNGSKVGPKDDAGKANDITTATEMYYDITNAATTGNKIVTITNGMANGSILSLTNVKVTFTSKTSEKVTFTMSEAAAAEAVQMVRAMYAPAPEPDPEPVIFTPERFEASWNRSTVKVGQKATLTVKTSEDVEAITVDGVTIDTYRTRTQRTGWGWNAKRVTYREFTYTITASETADHEIVAVNAENTASEAITAALTVQAAAQRPSWGGWLGNLFGRWF